MNITDNKIVRGALIALLICASLALVAEAISIFSRLNTVADITKVPTIVVSGEGQATVIPDIAEFSFTVDKTAATVAAAQAAATALTNKAIAAVKAAGVADKDIQTTDYSINPHYTYSSQPTACPLNGCSPVRQIPDGYEVSQTINVKVETASTTGQILQTVGSLGVTNVSGITFTESNPNAAKDEARAKAITDAEQKAEVLASQLGVALGHVVSFQESNNYPRPIMFAASVSVANTAAVAPSIPTGQNTVTDDVTITYEIN